MQAGTRPGSEDLRLLGTTTANNRNTPESIPPSKATSMAMCCEQHYAMPKRQFYGQIAHQSPTRSGAVSGIGGNSSSSAGRDASCASKDFGGAGSMISVSPSLRLTAFSPGSS